MFFSTFIIASSCCIWYFSPDKENLGKPIRKSFTRVTSYHLGSIALASGVVALVKLIRIIVN